MSVKLEGEVLSLAPNVTYSFYAIFVQVGSSYRGAHGSQQAARGGEGVEEMR